MFRCLIVVQVAVCVVYDQHAPGLNLSQLRFPGK